MHGSDCCLLYVFKTVLVLRRVSCVHALYLSIAACISFLTGSLVPIQTCKERIFSFSLGRIYIETLPTKKI